MDDGQPARTWVQQEHWLLVLQSRHIPCLQLRKGHACLFYVPALYEHMARTELCGFSEESRRAPLPSAPAPHSAGNWAVLLLMILLLWHGLRAGWWPWATSLLPVNDAWNALAGMGSADAVRMKVYHQWYRAVTALTLHADSQHILGNLAFGGIFLTLLCRATGLGVGLLLTTVGGTLGNICNALTRQGAHNSLGFSTALFAAVGALSGTLAMQSHPKRGKALAPLAAGGAILAMLGAEGERTDYGAHIWGLACGMALGILTQRWQNSRPLPAWAQWLAAAATAALLGGGWWLAGLHA